jgi:dihydrofolate reductase
MEIKPFINIVVAMDEKNAIGHEKKIPWAPLPTDYNWYLTHATTTKDPLKRVALILGRFTFEDAIKFDQKYVSRWHFIVITSQLPEILYNTYSNIDRNQVDVVNSFDQAAQKAKLLLDTPSSMIESVFVFGGVGPYEQALESKLVKRIYLTRIFAEVPDCDARISKFDLSDFQRIKRPSDEILAELDDKIIEENGWKYQFQVYEQKDL